MATRTNINISNKTSNGRRLSQAEIEANRRRLAAVIAHAEPGRAIVAPPGVGDLKEIGIKPSKPKREIFKMDNEPDVIVEPGQPPAEGTAVMAPKRGRKPSPSEEEVRAMHARYVEIGNIREAAKEFGRNAGWLAKQFKALGLPVTAPGGNRKTAKATAKAPTPSSPKLPKPSDNAIREIHADWMRCGGSLLDVAMRYRIDQNILRKRFRALGLDDTGVRIPYERPSVATLPLNGSGPHVAAAVEAVTEAADTNEPSALLTTEEIEQAAAQAVGAPTHQETAVQLAPLPQVDGMGALSRAVFLLESLQAMGSQVQVSGEINIRIVFGQGARP